MLRGRPWALAVCLWLASQGETGAVDYAPITLACMLARADAVAVARVPDGAPGARYRICLTRVLRGSLATGDLEVIEPAPWRGTPPQFETREALFFLRAGPAGTWEVSGPSGEGRVALGPTEADVRGLTLPAAATAEGKVARELLVSALAAASDCFAFQAAPGAVKPRARCDRARIEREKAQSELHRALLAQLESARAAGLACRF